LSSSVVVVTVMPVDGIALDTSTTLLMLAPIVRVRPTPRAVPDLIYAKNRLHWIV
jgi:hypothetical protein